MRAVAPTAGLVVMLLAAPVLVPAPVRADTADRVEGPTHHARSVVWAGEVAYYFGGRSSANQFLQVEDHDDIVVFDPLGVLETLNGTLPTRRSWTSAVWDPRPTGACPAGCAYVFGGLNGHEGLADVVRFEPEIGTATVVASLPSARWATAAAWTGEVAYVLGGRDASGLIDEVLRFDPVSEALDLVARLPEAVAESAAGWDPRPSTECPAGCAYLMGGSDAGGPLASVIQFAPGGTTRRIGPSLPDPLAAPSAAWTGAEFLIAGGDGGPAHLFALDMLRGKARHLHAPDPGNLTGASAFWDPRELPDFSCPQGCLYLQGGEAPYATYRINLRLPSSPHITAAGGPGPGRILVAWQPHHDDAITGYLLFRRPGPQAEPVHIATLAADSTGYIDTVPPLPWPAWTYEVRATNAAGAGSWSAAVCAPPVPWDHVPPLVRSLLAYAAGSSACTTQSSLHDLVGGYLDLIARQWRFLWI